MFHRYPFLSLLTFAYLGFVGWLTLTPTPISSDNADLIQRLLVRLQRIDDLSWLTYNRLEFIANIGLFVPVGLFLLLLFGTRYWWVSAMVGFAMTVAIETVQRSIPERFSDERDILANTIGTLIGVAAGVVLTLPATLRRHRRRRAYA